MKVILDINCCEDMVSVQGLIEYLESTYPAIKNFHITGCGECKECNLPVDNP